MHVSSGTPSHASVSGVEKDAAPYFFNFAR